MIRYKGVRSFLKHTSSGHLFKVWREEPLMPRFDDRFLDCSLYLYPTSQDAIAGARAGGSGFLAVVDGVRAGEPIPQTGLGTDEYRQQHFHYYAVSNRHVVTGYDVIGGRGNEPRPPSTVVRLNKHDGKNDVIDLSYDDWVRSEDHDIAVAPITYNAAHKYLFVSVISWFLTEIIAKDNDIGIGDEVFMVGRLVHADGKQRNSPCLRWGHVSMMPFEPVQHPSNPSREQKGFLVEVHSISGFSGSPVFVRPFSTPKVMATCHPTETLASRYYGDLLPGGPWLLGVDWGHIRNHDQSQNNTGIAGVVPAWHVTELLNTEKLVMQRKQEEDERKRKREQIGTVLDSSEGDSVNFTRQDFEDALKRVSRKVRPAEEPPSESGQGKP